MRIAYFTPFDRDSAVGKCCGLILPALSRRHEVEVWHPAAPEALDALVPVIPFEPRAALGDPRLESYDHLVYQMGNDPARFSTILEVAQFLPGVHILADYSLHGLLASYYLSRLRRPVAYLRAMESAYGGSARRLAEDSIAGLREPVWAPQFAAEFPLFEPVIGNALGVVVNSRFHLQAIQRAFSGPSTAINLPSARITATTDLSSESLGVGQDRIVVLSHGYVNQTKLNGAVIEALRESPELARRVLFVVAGQHCPVEGPRLRSMVRDFQLENSVRFTGFVSDETLHAWLVHADLCVNLRQPNTESASGSLIQQMLHGKAVVVLATGFFGEMPEDTVVRVEPDSLGRLHELLLRLVLDRPRRERVGAAAKRFAEATFDPDVCGGQLADFLEEIGSRQTR